MPFSSATSFFSGSHHPLLSMLDIEPYTAYICSLSPLHEQGEKALICADARLETIRLTEVRIDWGGVYGEVQLYHSADCFRSPRFKAKLASLPVHANLTSAAFSVKHPGNTAWHQVIIKPPNTVLYENHNNRQCLETWLIKRKFLQLR